VCCAPWQLRDLGNTIMDMELKEQKLLADLKNRCQKVGRGWSGTWLCRGWTGVSYGCGVWGVGWTEMGTALTLCALLCVSRVQVVELQMALDSKEEELKAAQKANKREQLAKLANEVWLPHPSLPPSQHTHACTCMPTSMAFPPSTLLHARWQVLKQNLELAEDRCQSFERVISELSREKQVGGSWEWEREVYMYIVFIGPLKHY
jgi:hypothetical protein